MGRFISAPNSMCGCGVVACFSAVSTVDQPITTTPASIFADKVESEIGVSYNPANGEGTITRFGCYDIRAILHVVVQSSNSVAEFWIEVSTDGGTTWAQDTDSGWRREFMKKATVEVTFQKVSQAPAGTMFRLMGVSNKATGISLSAVTLANGISMPGVRFSVKG